MKIRQLLFVTTFLAVMAWFGCNVGAQTTCPECWWWIPFTFPSGANLPGQTESNGMTWAAAGPAGPPITIVSNSLTVPGLAPPVGNKARLAGVTGPAARIGFATNLTSGTLYYSLALNISNLSSNGQDGATLAGFN